MAIMGKLLRSIYLHFPNSQELQKENKARLIGKDLGID